MLKHTVRGVHKQHNVSISERRLWQDETRNTPSLGCWGCPERGLCGMLAVEAGLTSCLDLCCGQPATCDKTCRNNPDFAFRVREVGTFGLDNVPRAPVLNAPVLPLVAPVLFHSGCRKELIGPATVALPLYKMFDRRDGKLRFSSNEELSAAFGLVRGTSVILTGTDQDPPLERWWGYQSRRREIAGRLAAIGVVLTTTPNFSVFVDVPRQTDLHAIKRIGLGHAEFLGEGLPCALHINGRTEADFLRWADYVRSRPEVTHLAYEFTTGTARARRRPVHLEWLTGIARDAGRPLTLIVRGGIEILPQLSAAFDRICVLETWSFMKTMKRQRAEYRERARPRWRRSPTPVGSPLDKLFSANRTVVARWIEGAAGASLPVLAPVKKASGAH